MSEKIKTLPINASDEEIRALVLEWNELLAQEKYEEAINFILYKNTRVVDGEVWIWTPEKLEAAVYTYGMPWYSKEEYETEYGEGAADLKVASLLCSPNSKELLDKISFEINLIIIRYQSDSYVLFEKIDENHMTLCFQDLYVM